MRDESAYNMAMQMQPRAGLRIARLTPTEAEIFVRVEAVGPNHREGHSGQLTGPRCAYSSTVEVAYPFRQFRRVDGAFEGRAVIPDPAWWDVESPFLYAGFVDQCGARLPLTCGLRHAAVAGGSLVWNGRPMTLRAVRTTDPPAARLSGFNVAVVPLAGLNEAMAAADRCGILVVVEGGGLIDIDTVAHPSALGRLDAAGVVTLFGGCAIELPMPPT